MPAILPLAFGIAILAFLLGAITSGGSPRRRRYRHSILKNSRRR